MAYRRRIVDDELDELFPHIAAIAIEGAKAVGKTETASRRVRSTISLDDENLLAVVQADPQAILRSERSLLVDEWQLYPPVWDVIRRAVDNDRSGGQFLLAGSAMPSRSVRIHSGAGRIVSLQMRPMAFCERGVSEATVSLRSLLNGSPDPLVGQTALTLADYVHQILASGFPGITDLPRRPREKALLSYVTRALDRDLTTESGLQVRRPSALRGWLTAYAAATSTTASYNAILDAATPGESEKPARQTVAGYREALERMWLIDPLPAWWPTFSQLKRLTQAPKHHLADPALAAVLLNATEESLLAGKGRTAKPAGHTLLGALFESLVTLSVRAMASASEANTYHLRTGNGDHEIDLILERRDGNVIAIEIKLGNTVSDQDVRHLNWLAERIGDRLIDRVVINTSKFAYRRPDGVAVIPLALLGV